MATVGRRVVGLGKGPRSFYGREAISYKLSLEPWNPTTRRPLSPNEWFLNAY